MENSPTPLPAYSGLSVGQLARIVWWRRWTVLAVFVFIVGTTFGVSKLIPPSYKAVASVVLDVKGADPVFGPRVSSGVSPGVIATQIDIIHSERVALRVVNAMGLDKNPLAREMWLTKGEGRGTLEQFYADRMLGSLDVRPSRESMVISIESTWTDPAFAASVANAFARAYVETAVELRALPARKSAQWFDERVQQLRQKLEEADARRSEYQQQHEVLATDERVDDETARLSELNAQLTAILGQRAESRSRDREARGHMTNSPDVLHNTVIESLRGDIARAEARHRELGTQLGPNHPQFQRSQSELDTLKERLDAEMRQVTRAVTTTDAVVGQREAEIRAALEKQKRRVLDLRAQRDVVSVLQKDVESAQRAYEVASERLSQTRLESLSEQTNAQVLSEALPPAVKSSPNTLMNVVLAAIFGAILAVAAAVAREVADRRLRNVLDASQVFGLPVLATLTASRQRGSRRRLARAPFGLQSPVASA
jgi:chain length determinant protein EpsF